MSSDRLFCFRRFLLLTDLTKSSSESAILGKATTSKGSSSFLSAEPSAWSSPVSATAKDKDDIAKYGHDDDNSSMIIHQHGRCSCLFSCPHWFPPFFLIWIASAPLLLCVLHRHYPSRRLHGESLGPQFHHRYLLSAQRLPVNRDISFVDSLTNLFITSDLLIGNLIISSHQMDNKQCHWTVAFCLWPLVSSSSDASSFLLNLSWQSHRQNLPLRAKTTTFKGFGILKMKVDSVM